jgi:hypothetical protein
MEDDICSTSGDSDGSIELALGGSAESAGHRSSLIEQQDPARVVRHPVRRQEQGSGFPLSLLLFDGQFKSRHVF